MSASRGGGLKNLKKKKKRDKKARKGRAGLKMSTRSTYVLKEITDKGETLDLPDEENAPGNLVYCKLEYPDADKYDGQDVRKFKKFIVHATVNEGFYEGGTFRFEINLSKTKDYPMVPPAARMLTKIWHPNFDLENGICHSHLKLPGPPHDGSWQPGLRLQGLIDGLLLMFDTNSIGFNPDDPLNVEAAEQYIKDPKAFEKKAREWTKSYAKPVSIKKEHLAQKELDC